MAYLKDCTYINEFHKKEILLLAQKLLMAKETVKWAKDLENQAKLRTYRLFKTEFCVEKYVKMNLPRGLRSVLAQLRSGTLPLKIETGHFHNIKVENRLCEFCNNNVIESEYHFVFCCPLYRELRNVYIGDIAQKVETESECWKTLFSSFKHIRNLALFVSNALSKRASVVYK